MSEGLYDVVLYGASGFTGQQTVQYFAEHAPSTLRWAIAGRNRQKLETVAQSIDQTIDILVADGCDQAAVDAMVSQTRVLLNTAGPFALYGGAVVDACVRLQTHYVDITGETVWVRALIEQYHDRAAAEGTRIIPCCGFDSVPADLGTYLIVRAMQKQDLVCQSVRAYYEAAGGFNGGTLASAFNLVDSGQWKQASDLFLLNPPGARPARVQSGERDPLRPHYDQVMGTWTAPFFMGPVNTRVVRRSGALYNQWQESYGPQFQYQEYLKFSGPLAGVSAIATTIGTALFAVIAQQLWARRWLQPYLPQPGEGPSEQTMDQGWFRCQLLGTGTKGEQVKGLLYNQGDPGNRSTVKFLCESALALALDFERLPGGAQRGGILTPATGLGDVLADRLRQAGTVINIPG
ncbi:MAG: saccharopine dehydrogenase family protein [Thermosynechococcaceae cyanobacterium]